MCSTEQVGEAEKQLEGAAGINPYTNMVDEADGLDKIEELQVGIGSCCHKHCFSVSGR